MPKSDYLLAQGSISCTSFPLYASNILGIIDDDIIVALMGYGSGWWRINLDGAIPAPDDMPDWMDQHTEWEKYVNDFALKHTELVEIAQSYKATHVGGYPMDWETYIVSIGGESLIKPKE